MIVFECVVYMKQKTRETLKPPKISLLDFYREIQNFRQIFYLNVGEKYAKALPGCIIYLSTVFFHKVCI